MPRFGLAVMAGMEQVAEQRGDRMALVVPFKRMGTAFAFIHVAKTEAVASFLPVMTVFSRSVEDLPRRPDLAIVGGGIVGLWCAERAVRAGLSTVLVEAERIGGGASGGVVGALMPHQPVNWSAKKQFQLDGLLSLGDEVAALEAATGLGCGYRRAGRLIPLKDQSQRERNESWGAGAAECWARRGDFAWQVLDGNPAHGWLAEEAAASGFALETLSARISPRLLGAALKARIEGGVTVIEGVRVADISRDGGLRLGDGAAIRPGRTIVAAGYQSFGLLAALAPSLKGQGVKGQAALFRPLRPADPSMPVIFDEGVYIIAHDDGTVAVGSTSENDWQDASSTDGRLNAVIERARAICPVLRDAPVIERWAGVRPKSDTRHPVVEAHGDSGRVIVATGGFKITLAVAHLMADRALALAGLN